MLNRVVLIVCDSLGIGNAPDAKSFGDDGANTFGNIVKWCKENSHLFLTPNLDQLGLRMLISECESPQIEGAACVSLVESSKGKDTTTGHWEIAGRVLQESFPTFPDGFSEAVIKEFLRPQNLEGYLGNHTASGTQVIDDYGEEHMLTAKPIIYTSADSVLQIACHEESFGLQRLYSLCEEARRALTPLGVGRVIARPFRGSRRGNFQRTENRRDYSLEPPAPNMLDIITEQALFVAGVGKIKDIFAGRSVGLSKHTGNNKDSSQAILEFMDESKGQKGLIFANLIDFDMHFGHRRDPKGYADCLRDFDSFLPELYAKLGPEDLLLVTGDHGNDPTFKGSDHTRENVPLLARCSHEKFRGGHLGTKNSFSCIARLTLEALGLESEVSKIDGLQSKVSLWSEWTR